MRNKEQEVIYQQRLLLLASYGMLSNDYSSWKSKWQALHSNANLKGVSCSLSFEQYLTLAHLAGLTRPDQIGKTMDEYQMGRIGDVGNYEMGNCRFITRRQNQREKTDNGGNYRIGSYSRGYTKLDKESIASMADKLSKNFLLVSPDGEEHRGKNLKEFCEQHDLDPSCMRKVCRKVPKYNSHKGWTGEYLENQ